MTSISEKLWNKFEYRHLTPATLELMHQELLEIQRNQARIEGNDAWLIPIDIQVDKDNPTRTVLVPDLKAVLILDFDS